MDFNDSFGPKNNIDEKENNENNISFEGNQNNNNISFEGNQNKNNMSFEGNNFNNISFEDNKEKEVKEENNLSFENMKIDDKNNNQQNKKEEEKQNDIFNAVPMAIKNQENQDLIYYENQLITEKIKYNLYLLLTILKKNIYLKKAKFFEKLGQISNYKLSKIVKAEILFLNIQHKLSTFKNIERNWRIKLLREIFLKLKLLAKTNKYKETEDKIKETEIKKKIKEMNDNLKRTENNLKEVTDNVDKLKSNEKSINNELDELNKKNSKLNTKYTNLVSKSKELKEAIMQKMSNFSSTLDKTLDPRIVELQNMIKSKERDKEKSINYFEEFYKKMSDILDMYEANYENIKSTINLSNASNS